MEGGIDVRFFPAPPDLAASFATFYRADFNVADGQSVRDLVLPEWGNIRFFRDDCPTAENPVGGRLVGARFAASGPSVKSMRFELGTTRMWGIGFFPLGWAKFCAAPASELADRIVDGERHPAFAGFAHLAAELFDQPPNDDRECARILECVRALDREVPDEARIRRIHAALIDPAIGSVDEFAGHAGLGRRTLERLCHRYFGFAPKQLLRRQRFMRSLAQFMQEHDANWSEALDAHYHDQSQFVRDFRAVMGMSPREYAAREHPILAAFLRERARVWRSAAQTLDRPPAPQYHPPSRAA